jgi:small subunit ribosomal protein S1
MKGRRMFLKVIEINRRRNRLILSERAAIQERRAVQKDRLLGELKEGEVRHGRVSSLCDFGAFIDLGGADGLVHLSELSWGQVGHPSQLLKVGQAVDVAVVGVDRDNKKIALSLKRLQPEPWEGVEERYQAGDIVRGRITKLASFGAFAQIEQGVEGLIHISELSDERIMHPKGVVKEGDEVPLKIIRIDAARHRLGLSLRQALEQGEEIDEAPIRAEDSAADESSTAEAEDEGLAHKVPSPVGEQEAENGRAEASEASPTDEVDEDSAEAVAPAAESPEADAIEEEAEAPEESPAHRSAKASSGE